jgi:hypothetical protein
MEKHQGILNLDWKSRFLTQRLLSIAMETLMTGASLEDARRKLQYECSYVCNASMLRRRWI